MTAIQGMSAGRTFLSIPSPPMSAEPEDDTDLVARAAALPEGRKVREALTEARLRKLQSEAGDA